MNSIILDLRINLNFDGVHFLVSLLVIGCIDENLVKNLVQARHIGDLSRDDALLFGIVHPHLLGDELDRADVRIWTQKNML